MKYINSQEAFEDLYKKINKKGLKLENTKVIYNVGFYLLNPLDNKIKTLYRNWSIKYAEREWEWYLKGDPNGIEISKFAPTWLEHMDEYGNIRSNYGWQWRRNNALEKVIEKLKTNNNSRQAVISLYDSKEIDTYFFDTPCTNSIHFQIINGKLCMTVNMRSNDLWLGFCNDQFCFSNLQNIVAKSLNKPIGWYYHFSSNMHLYSKNLCN